MAKPKLKYLFEVEYADGSLFNQTPDDVSAIDKERNCFYDVLQSGKTIRRFSLIGEGNRVTVDLGNGIFYINSLPVLLESEKLPTLPDKFDLIWYHQTSQSQTATYKVKKFGFIKLVKKENLPEFREYFIGWQCNIKGKNYKQKLAVS